jgi:hypothetical protein
MLAPRTPSVAGQEVVTDFFQVLLNIRGFGVAHFN